MITGRVRGQEFKLSSPLIVADTIDYLTALFTFHTADWAGLDICSHWQNGAVVYDIWLENGQITKDKHLNLSAGTWTVWLHGNENVDGKVLQRITTEKAELIVKTTGILNGEPFPDVPGSAGEQIIALAHKAVDDADVSAKNAAQSAESAEKSAERAEQVAVANGYMEFELENEDGILYLVRTDNIVDEVDFELNEETGELEVIIE